MRIAYTVSDLISLDTFYLYNLFKFAKIQLATAWSVEFKILLVVVPKYYTLALYPITLSYMIFKLYL